jgi:NADPH:quinone reductase-like Zn-dependent oxidoreductase
LRRGFSPADSGTSARAAGIQTIITSSNDAKLEKARKLGADATINYRTHPEWQDTFTFDQVREAYQYLDSGSHFGKVVVKVGAT